MTGCVQVMSALLLSGVAEEGGVTSIDVGALSAAGVGA